MKTKEFKNLFNWEYVKDRLFIKVLPKNGNEYLISQAPLREIEDLIIVPYVSAEDNDEEVFVVVSFDMLKAYDLGKKVLIDCAINNSEHILPSKVINLDSLISNMTGIPTAETNMPAQIVITNNRYLFGASALFYPAMMIKLAKICKGNYFILPSSIHELIIMPDKGDFTYEELKEMVMTINYTQVDPEERLTDEVYYYDAIDREFRKGR